jgi:hypothetical protein
MNYAAPTGIQLTPTAHDALSSAAAGTRTPPPGLCPGNKPPPIDVSKAIAYQVIPTTKISSAKLTTRRECRTELGMSRPIVGSYDPAALPEKS